MATRIRNCPAGPWSATRTPPYAEGPFDDSRRSFHFHDDGKVIFLTPVALLAKLASLFYRPRNFETGQSLRIVISSSTEPYDKIQNHCLLKLQ
jgi:hypothetical protein